jgi:signal peptidase
MADRGPLGDIAFAAVIFVLLFGGLYAYAGGWPPMVSVISDSMSPHMEKGDLVLIQGLSRGDVKTYEGPESLNYTSFEERGDVIVYRPEGEGTPTIHRAIRWVEQGEPMWHNGPAAPWAGYITLGDNNQGVLDQMAPSICYEQPVKKEWIVGIARFRIPFLGYIRSVIPW